MLKNNGSYFVINRTMHLIECSVKYDGHPGEDKFDEVVNTIIQSKSEHYFPRISFNLIYQTHTANG
jgi:hypothetical protein